MEQKSMVKRSKRKHTELQAVDTGTSVPNAVVADVENTWWDPTDSRKVPVSMHV